jgi:hypothetical protein
MPLDRPVKPGDDKKVSLRGAESATKKSHSDNREDCFTSLAMTFPCR